MPVKAPALVLLKLNLLICDPEVIPAAANSEAVKIILLLLKSEPEVEENLYIGLYKVVAEESVPDPICTVVCAEISNNEKKVKTKRTKFFLLKDCKIFLMSGFNLVNYYQLIPALIFKVF